MEKKFITDSEKEWMLKCIVNTIETNANHPQMVMLEVLLKYFGSGLEIDYTIYNKSLEFLDKVFYED